MCFDASLSASLLGTKFVIKQSNGVRKQFLILNGEIVLAFVADGQKFVNCPSYTEVTTSVDCKVGISGTWSK